MQFEFEDKTYTYDPAGLDVRTAMVIKVHTGHGLKSWNEAVQELEPDAVQALFWAVKQQNGEPCEIASLNFSIPDFMAAFETAFLADTKAQLEKTLREEKANPKAGGSGPRRASTRKPTRTSAATAPSTSSS